MKSVSAVFLQRYIRIYGALQQVVLFKGSKAIKDYNFSITDTSLLHISELNREKIYFVLYPIGYISDYISSDFRSYE